MSTLYIMVVNVHCTSHCTLYTVTCLQYSVQCLLHTVHCIMYTLHKKAFSIQCTLLSDNLTNASCPRGGCTTLLTLGPCIVATLQCTLYCAQCNIPVGSRNNNNTTPDHLSKSDSDRKSKKKIERHIHSTKKIKQLN